MLTARELGAAGARVTLVERNQIGKESSWAGGGILSPLYPWRYSNPVTALASWSQRRYPQLASDLADDTGIDPQWTENGLLILDPQERDEALDWGVRTGNAVAQIETPEIANLEPGLAQTSASALWLPQVAQIRNPRLIKALRTSLETTGVTIREHTEIRKLRVASGRILGVEIDAAFLAAERVIVCAGAWSTQVLRSLGVIPQIKPVHGQMLLFAAKPETVQRIVLHASRYAIPRRDGHVLVGSTLEDIGFNKRTTAEAREDLYSSAIDLFPALAEAPIARHWSGLRPGSPGGVPYIGEHPKIRGLYLNSGHFRNGVVLGPASARLLADIVLGRPAILPPEPYAWDAPRLNWET